MKKITVLLALIFVLTAGVTVYASAADMTSANTSPETMATIPTDTVAIDELTEEPIPWPQYVFDFARDHAMEILSTLALIASSLVAWLNKHKLFPAISGFIAKVSKFIKEQQNANTDWQTLMEERINAGNEKNNASIEEQKTLLQEYSQVITEAIGKINGLTEALQEDAKARNIVMKSLEDQEDVLHTIVQGSDLPQFRKREAEEKHLAHLAAIADMKADKTPTGDGENT